MAHWLSTARLAQLSGDYDPEGLAHHVRTGPWGVSGVDLGANTVHEGRTVIFFGDVPPANNDLVAYIDDIPVPAGAHLAAARQGADQLDVFFIGADGALCVMWAVGGDAWQGPVRLSRPDLAPPGGAMAAAHQGADQLDVFFLGLDGGLYVSWVVGGGTWSGPLRISGPGQAPPGARLTAFPQGDDQLDVVYIGHDRRLHVHWVAGGGVWQDPVALGPGPVAPPGAAVAAFEQVPGQVDVVFIGDDERLNVQWAVGGGEWQGPVGLGPPRVAPPGANLAAFEQVAGQHAVVFVGHNRHLHVQWVVGGGEWQGPVGLGQSAVAPAGAGVTAVRQGAGDQTTVLFLDDQGRLDVQWTVGGGEWQGPVAVTALGMAPAGAPLVSARQSAGLTVALAAGATGQLHVAWVEDGGAWQGPAPLNPEMTNLRPVLQGGTFHPFMVREGARTWRLGSDSTPTGAFSHGGKAYVFVLEGGGDTVSSLTRSTAPTEPVPFDLLFRFSFLSDSSSGKFWQVAPSVASARDLPGFEAETAEGAVLLGHGFTRRPGNAFGVHLAWLPLPPDKDPALASIRYYTGTGPQGWSGREADAAPLFGTRFGWASLSVGRVPGTGHWIVLYHTAGGRDDIGPAGTADAPIIARIAPTPWDLAGAPEIAVFDPVRDGALGHFMFRPGQPDPMDLEHRGHPLIGHPAFAYGPHLLNGYTRLDQEAGLLTIHYLISTGWPYQVQLMRTVLSMG